MDYDIQGKELDLERTSENTRFSIVDILLIIWMGAVIFTVLSTVFSAIFS